MYSFVGFWGKTIPELTSTLDWDKRRHLVIRIIYEVLTNYSPKKMDPVGAYQLTLCDSKELDAYPSFYMALCTLS